MTKLDAKHYEENSFIQKTIASEVIGLFPVQKSDLILDIGCGDGYLSAKLAEIACEGQVTGIDPSQEMITHASETYPSNKFQNLMFQIGKADSAHGVEQYTLITAFNCIHWSHSLPDTFKNCFKALKQDGKFIGVTYPKESIYWGMFSKVLSRPKWKKYLSLTPVSAWLSTEEYSQLALDMGYKILFLQSEDCLASYANHNDLRDYIKGWLACLLPIDQNEQNNFLVDVLEFAENEYKNKSSIDIPYTKLIFCFLKQ